MQIFKKNRWVYEKQYAAIYKKILFYTTRIEKIIRK